MMILYDPIKDNIVADASSRKIESMGSSDYLEVSKCPLAREVRSLANCLMLIQVLKRRGLLARVEATSTFLDQSRIGNLRIQY